MSNIMVIRKEAKEIAALWEQTEGELTPELEAEYGKLLQMGEAGVAILADVRDELEARMNERKAKAKVYTELAKKDEAMLDNNKKYLMAIMDVMGMKKVTVGALVVTKSDGRESVNVFNEDAVPLKYKKATITIPATKLEIVKAVLDAEDILKESLDVDKTAITELHKSSEGEMGVEGTEIVRTPYVTIKG